MDSVHADRVLLCRVSPFGHPRIKAHLRLPVAFRSLSRPSSALSAKAFPLRPLQLDQLLSGYLSISRIIRVISVLLAICSTIFRSYPNNFQKNLKLIYIKIGITFIFLYCCFCFRYCSVFKVQTLETFSCGEAAIEVFFAYFLVHKKVSGGLERTRTSDLTLIRRAL